MFSVVAPPEGALPHCMARAVEAREGRGRYEQAPPPVNVLGDRNGAVRLGPYRHLTSA